MKPLNSTLNVHQFVILRVFSAKKRTFFLFYFYDLLLLLHFLKSYFDGVVTEKNKDTALYLVFFLRNAVMNTEKS